MLCEFYRGRTPRTPPLNRSVKHLQHSSLEELNDRKALKSRSVKYPQHSSIEELNDDKALKSRRLKQI
jgi:hypothetical protein